MNKNVTLAGRSLSAVWHPCTQMKLHEHIPLIPIERAAGVWLYDYAGQRYLDAISSWWVNLFGHANPRITSALKDQLDCFEHVMLAGLTHEPAVRLAEKLSQLTHGELGHCFFAADGACAVEIALKMSAHYWRNVGQPGKNTFVSLKNSYHGETLGALSVGDVPLFKESYGALLRPQAHVTSPDWRDGKPQESPAAFARRCAEELDQYLHEHHAHVAAFIIEPLVQGAAGMAMHHPDYLSLAREICNRHHVHIIADEIATGLGRTGTFFGCEQAHMWPDFLCLSKGITGGYLPLSVVLTRHTIYDAFYSDDLAQGFLHSHSYSGNALACTAALATLSIFEEDRVIETNRLKGQRFSRLMEPLARHPSVKNFRCCGMIWAFDVPSAQANFARQFFKAALSRELLLRPIGKTVYVMPPYVISEADIAFLVEGIGQILDDYDANKNTGAALVG